MIPTPDAQGLLPCPFCGSYRLSLCKTEFVPEKRPAYAVTCRTRDCAGVVFTLGYGQFESEREAIEAWNRRAGEGERE